MQYVFLFLVYTIPAFAYAVTTPTDFRGVVALILSYVNLLIPVVFGLAFIVVIWGVVNAWIINVGDTEKMKEGHMMALWGALGLAVMAGLWGLIAIVRTSLFNM